MDNECKCHALYILQTNVAVGAKGQGMVYVFVVLKIYDVHIFQLREPIKSKNSGLCDKQIA